MTVFSFVFELSGIVNDNGHLDHRVYTEGSLSEKSVARFFCQGVNASGHLLELQS